jgi:hypothetical protein
MHGPQGPGSGPGRQISRGGISKKIEIEVWYAGKKKNFPRERNLREIYTENNVGTTARPSFLVTTLLALVGAEAIAYFSWAQGRKIPK